MTAQNLVRRLCSYDRILTAQTFLQIFERTTPLSNYLQTSGIDLLKAHSMLQSTLPDLKSYARDFEMVKKLQKICEPSQ